MGLDLSRHQKRMAEIIIQEGLQMGFDWRDIKIGLMTAYQESKLQNLDYGHSSSLGLFQQRWDMGWGTKKQIMDPHYAARKFFSVLRTVHGRKNMPLWEAAQAVQRSAYPTAYRQWHNEAANIIKWYRSGHSDRGASFHAGPDPTFETDPKRFDLTTTPGFTNKRGGQKKRGPLDIQLPSGIEASNQPLVLPTFSRRRDFNDAMMAEGMRPPGNTGNMNMNQIRKRLIRIAKGQIGVPYVWGGESPSGFDCSGFTQWVYAQIGVNLPRVSYQQGQRGYKAFGHRVQDFSKMKPGDLVFWDNSSRNSGADHVAIYLGHGKIIEAPRPGRSVGISNLYDLGNAWGVHLNL